LLIPRQIAGRLARGAQLLADIAQEMDMPCSSRKPVSVVGRQFIDDGADRRGGFVPDRAQ